jgi:hypothetical protein
MSADVVGFPKPEITDEAQRAIAAARHLASQSPLERTLDAQISKPLCL